jgi:hypothetical protein
VVEPGGLAVLPGAPVAVMEYTLRTDPSWRFLEVGDRRWPIASFDNRDSGSGDFVHYVRRARLLFENGWMLSIVWGSCTYSTNYDAGAGTSGPFTGEPSTVELAAWNDRLDTGMVTWPGGDTVEGYVPVSDLPEIIDTIGRLPSASTEMLVLEPPGPLALD